MLDLIGVSHRAGREAVLDRATLRIEAGRALVVLAPAGSGRAGLLKLLAGLERPAEGSIRFGTEEASKSKFLKDGVFWVRKHGAEPVGRKARAVIGSAARAGGLKGQAVDAEVARAAQAAGLSGKLEAVVKTLSLEDRVRLTLASAAARKPKLLLLDDPLGGLEGEARLRMMSDISVMLAESGRVVIVYATASPDEARAIGGDIAVIEDGRIAQLGPAAEVLDHPRDIATAKATSHPALNLMRVDWFGAGRRRLLDGSTFAPPPGLAVPDESGFTLAFRPADALAVRHDEDAVRFVVRGVGGETVDGVRYARVAFAGAEWLMALPPSGDPAPGLMLNAFVDRGKLMVFMPDGAAFVAGEAKRAAG
jgi:ABC-type sugar transport system ATPase subunit